MHNFFRSLEDPSNSQSTRSLYLRMEFDRQILRLVFSFLSYGIGIFPESYKTNAGRVYLCCVYSL